MAARNIAGSKKQSLTSVASQSLPNGKERDLRLKMASSDEQVMEAETAGDKMPLSPGSSTTESSSDYQPLSPADAGRNVAVDYMKSRYEGENVKKDQVTVPKVIREPKKLDFQWDKVVDEKLKRSDPTMPVIKEQDLVALMLTCAGLDSGKSQYLSIVENSARDLSPVVNREPVEKVAPPEITKKVRNMFETGNLTELHESTARNETYEVLPGSGVFENEPVRIEGVVRGSDFSEEGEGVQRGTTKNLLDHWKTKMTNEDFKTTRHRPVFVVEGEGMVLESTPVRSNDVVSEDGLDWDVAHIDKGLTKTLLNQWSSIGSAEFKSDSLESKVVQKGSTKTLLSQWSVKGTEEAQPERKRINVADAEGKVLENEPIRRLDVVRENDVNLEGEQVEKGLTKNLLNQWKTKDKEEFRLEKRTIVVAEDEGRVVENEPLKRNDVTHAYDTDESDTVQKGTTKSLLAQWKTKGREDFGSVTKRHINVAEAEGYVLENEPIRRADVVREDDVVIEGEHVQRGTTRSLLNQWQNKRDEFRKDKSPIIVAEAEGIVAENEPTKRNDVVRENDNETEAERIQRGTTKALLSQWQNKREDFIKKTPIVVAEAEGTIAENDPIRRTDVIREQDLIIEGEVVHKGTTKSLLNQWKIKGSQDFEIVRNPIDIADGEGKVVENEPIQRTDVIREYDSYAEGEQVQKGITKNLMEQWRNKGSEGFQIAKKKKVPTATLR